MSNAQTGDKTFCLHGEEHADVIEIGLFGKHLLIVSCGPFGERNCRTFEEDHLERETVGILKIKKSKIDIKYSLLRSLFEYWTMIILGGLLCSSIVELLDHMNVHL